MRTVLVTGGAGFIGSHVCEELLRREMHPIVIDNLSSGKRENLPPGVEFMEGDIRDLGTLSMLCHRVDAVVHLAAEPSVVKSIEDPIGTHGSNYVGTLNLLEAMCGAAVARLVYASSAAVYPASDQPQREDGPTQPSSPYGLDKLMGEHAIRIFGNLRGVKGTALRFFNIYGPRQDPSSPYSGVISVFHSRIAAGLPITVNGTGRQSRDFVFVKDLAWLIVEALISPDAPALMNVGTGVGSTLLELIEALKGTLGRDPEVRFGPPRAGDILHSIADTSRIPDAWRPRTPLSVGLSNL